MTLLEVMVAVALLALMGVLVYSSLVITIKSQQRAELLQERYHGARVFLHRIKRELSMAYLSLHQAEDQRTQTLFDGGDDQDVGLSAVVHGLNFASRKTWSLPCWRSRSLGRL